MGGERWYEWWWCGVWVEHGWLEGVVRSMGGEGWW